MNDSTKNKIKGTLSALLVFIFCLFFIPIIAALVAGIIMNLFGEKFAPILSILAVLVIIVSIPLSFWAAWRRYRKFNPR